MLLPERSVTLKPSFLQQELLGMVPLWNGYASILKSQNLINSFFFSFLPRMLVKLIDVEKF